MNMKFNENYDFSIIQVIKEAYEKSYGNKTVINLAVTALVIISLVLGQVTSLVFNSASLFAQQLFLQGFISSQAENLLALPIIAPISVGLIMLGIKANRGEEIKVPMIFDYFVLVWPIFFVSLAVNVSTLLGYVVFVLPGIYLAFALMFSSVLLVDKKLSVLDAMKLSMKAVNKHWFKFLGYGISFALISILAVIPLGIGLLWSVPMSVIGFGILYSKMFDEVVESNDDFIDAEIEEVVVTSVEDKRVD